MNQQLPDINSSTRHRDKSIRAKILSNNNSIEWDNLINTSIPNTLKNHNIKINGLNKLSDVSYLKNPKKNALKIGTSIYKDPEIEQNKQEKNNFYNTLYRKTKSSSQFKTFLNKEQIQAKIIDVRDIFMETNPKIQQFNRYFTEILKQERSPLAYKEMIPPNRQQAVDLKDWMLLMLSIVKDEQDKMNTQELAEKIQLIYATCFKELIKQVSIECSERGDLLQTIWDYYIELIEQIMIGFQEQYKEIDQKHIEDTKRIYTNHDLILDGFRQKEQQLQQELIKQQEEFKLQISDALQTKQKMLTMTLEMRKLLESHERLKKDYDALMLQAMMNKTSDKDQKQSNEKLQLQFQTGHSIVSHLMNFQNELSSDRKIKTKTIKDSVFEQLEMLRVNEEQIKQDLIENKVIKKTEESNTEDVHVQTEQPQFEMKQTQTEAPYPQLKVQYPFMREKSDFKDLESPLENITECTPKINDMLKKSPQLDVIKERIVSMRTLLSSNSLDNANQQHLQDTIERIQEMIEHTKDLAKTMQELDLENQRLTKKNTTSGLKLMERESDIETLENTLTFAVQDFLGILENKQRKIGKLTTIKRQLSNQLFQISSKYNIQLDGIEENDENQNLTDPDFKEQDQDIDPIKEIEQNQEYSDAGSPVVSASKHDNDPDNSMIGTPIMKSAHKRHLTDEQQQVKRIDEEQHSERQLDQSQVDQQEQFQQSINQKLNQSMESPQSPQQSPRQVPRQSPQQSPKQSHKSSVHSIAQLDQILRRGSQISQEGQQQQTSKKPSGYSQSKGRQDAEQRGSVYQPSSSRQNQQPQQIQQIQQTQQAQQIQQTQQNQQTQQSQQQRVLQSQQSSSNVQIRQVQQQAQNSRFSVQINRSDQLNLSERQIEQEINKRNKNAQQQIQIGNRTDSNKYIPRITTEEDQNESDNEDGGNERNQRVKQIVNQYKDVKPKSKFRNSKFQLFESKAPKRIKKVYSQNTDVANNLMQETIKKSKPKKQTISLLQLQKIVCSILQDISKQSDGYKIPFHICIYDYFKNKYGFKQVAEKKIRQVYQFIYFNKESSPRLQLISQFCGLNTDIDEVGQKLQTESYAFFSLNFNLQKLETQLTFEAVNEFLSEKCSLWLSQKEIQTLQSQYKQQQQSQTDQRRQFIDLDQFLLKVLELYFNKKHEQEQVLNNVFQAADLDGNNLMEYSEFKTLYKALHNNRIMDIIQVFMSYADFQDENGDRFITLSRFAELSIEQGIFQKDQILKYAEGHQALINQWQQNKEFIKYRFLKARKFQKIKHTFIQLEEQIQNQVKERQLILWISFKLMLSQSENVIQKYETKLLLKELLSDDMLYIMEKYKNIESLE